ncbi:hypothetical protein [Pleomorphomonas oryzae]|uniref:hypothetical protein n=1 Tax=Pleomorphomonas oryzae TaxID=261934 RepID=UPI00040C0A6A|nr:hypothetical protein [Pleomorphomonas oryzae]
MRLAATRSDAPTGKPMAEGAGWLGLAATPTFAVMAWVTALGPPGMCTAAPPWMPVNDMALMYLLMSLFHLSPWLRVLSHRLAAPHRPN